MSKKYSGVDTTSYAFGLDDGHPKSYRVDIRVLLDDPNLTATLENVTKLISEVNSYLGKEFSPPTSVFVAGSAALFAEKPAPQQKPELAANPTPATNSTKNDM